MIRCLSLLVVAAFSVALPARAQQSSDRTAAAISAARALRESLHQVRGATYVSVNGDTLLARHIARALGGQVVGDPRRVDVCAQNPIRTCGTSDGAVMLQVSPIAVQNGTGTVRVEAWHPTGYRRIPTAYRRIIVHLIKRGGAWQVEREEVGELS